MSEEKPPQAPTGPPTTPSGAGEPTRAGAMPESDGSPSDMSGQVIGGDFRLLRRLGAGGMGQVYLGEQISLKRRVAVKMLRADLALSEVSRKRFKIEAEAVAKLAHANIVQVYYIAEQNGLQYMVLEYVEGWNLRDYLDRKGPPNLPIALAILRQVAAALARAGEMGIIHRDIKPENILLNRKAEVKVADFGLSRIVSGDQPDQQHLTQTGTTMGTPMYMSPEQVQSKPLDCRTDIYSFGVTAYHMLAGQPPFVAENSFDLALQHVQAEPLPLSDLRPDLPADLCLMVHKMMAKKPEDRYQNAREILRDLKRISEQESADSPQAASAGGHRGAAAMLGRRPRHRRTIAVACGALFAAAALGSGIGYVAKQQENSRITEHALTSAQSAAEPPPRSPDKERELDLIHRVKQTENPADSKDTTEKWDGVNNRIDLAYLYLYDRQPRDLEDAGKLFADMRRSNVKEYQELGALGEGIVLAFQDKAEQSVAIFQTRKLVEQVLPMRSQIGQGHFNKLQKMIRDALHHDQSQYIQNNKPFPPGLAAWMNLGLGDPPPGFPRRNDRAAGTRPEAKPPTPEK